MDVQILIQNKGIDSKNSANGSVIVPKIKNEMKDLANDFRNENTTLGKDFKIQNE